MDDHSLTVFKFSPRVTLQPSPSLPTAAKDKPDVSDADRAKASSLLAISVATTGWRDVNIARPESLTFGAENCYVYKRLPPSLSSLGVASKNVRREIKDWGSPCSPGELEDTEALQDFVSTKFTEANSARPARELSAPIEKGKRNAESPAHVSKNVLETMPKRAKLLIAFDSKFVDYYPYPFVPKPLHAKFQEHIPPFRKSVPIYVHPRAERYVREYMDEPFATSAWLVPIRGRLPWPEASEARIVGEGELVEGAEPILWTPIVLKNFWASLVSVYEQQSMGPISLSLHLASETDDDGCEILRQDHIKIRHNAPLALNVRTALDVLRCESTFNPERASENKGTSKPHKIRPLLGAKLVLVDDCSEGLMVV